MRRPGRRRQRGADHRRGEDQAAQRALLGLHRRGHAARSRRRVSGRSTKSSSAPISSAATSSPTACSTCRAREETLVLGAATVRPMVEKLLPGAHIVSRPRLSMLTYAGEKKLTRLPRRSAIVAFSAEEVYAIAELIRRQRGGAAVVLGALSPRTRNAQVALYQSGDVDYLVATDAIGMGLNLDVDHVAFASRPQIRRLSIPQAQSGRTRADRRPRRPRHPRRHFRHHRALRSVRAGTGAGAGKPQLRADAACCNGAIPISIFPRSARLQASLAMPPNEPGLTRAPIGGRHSRSGTRRARRRRARAGASTRGRSSGCGMSARFPIIARSRPPPMPNWS